MSDKRKLVRPTNDENAAINRGIENDPDSPEVTREQMAEMQPRRVRMGRPPADVTKVATSIRYDRDVLEAFRSTGDGWQTRINEVLREYAKSHHMI
ncbi:BrnA antitoxin family protein [Paraburkholderia acidicola]|uniref:BrnA antitoxin family protein n=1 Tax=Paraburkholderia acidicola TaxID=1912599 RepID=A0ABV1LUW7_9BURK